MFRIEFEFDLGRNKEIKVGNPPANDTSAELFEALAKWWLRTVAEPYRNLDTSQKLRPITIHRTFLKEEVSFDVAFDLSLLETLLEIYAASGWSAVEEIENRLSKLPNLYRPTKEFFRITRNVVAVMIGHGLVELEQQATEYAKQKWAIARGKLEEYLNAFDIVKVRSEHYYFRDRKLADALLQECHEYAVLAAEARYLQEKIDDRNRKDPPKFRQKGSGYELWFEVFAAPQREILTKMAESSKRILNQFPAALLVLHDLPDSILSAKTAYDKVKAKTELANMIGSALQSSITDLQKLEDSLKRPGVTLKLAQLLGPIITERRDFSRLLNLSLPQCGFEQEALDAVFDREEDEDQRLLANLHILTSLYEETTEANPGTWFQIVAYQYLNRLAETIDKKKEDEKFWDTVWSWIARVTALLGLIALMAFFPFGEFAAPALLTALTLCGSFSVILGILTMLHDLFAQVQKAGKLEADARDRFFRLAQTDPDAITEIGELLTRSKALRDGAITGSFVTILTLGAQRILKPVAIALEFQSFYQDVATLFGPAETDESEIQLEPVTPNG